jgi:hypothetical protein
VVTRIYAAVWHVEANGQTPETNACGIQRCKNVSSKGIPSDGAKFPSKCFLIVWLLKILKAVSEKQHMPKRGLLPPMHVTSELVSDADGGRRLVPAYLPRSIEGLIELLGEVAVTNFGAADPVLRQGVFSAQADSPAKMGVAVVEAIDLELGIDEYNAAGCVDEKIVDGIAGAKTSGTLPVALQSSSRLNAPPRYDARTLPFMEL